MQFLQLGQNWLILIFPEEKQPAPTTNLNTPQINSLEYILTRITRIR